jgi:hypothetical protein
MFSSHQAHSHYVREKETIMKHVSLSKIKPSMVTKVPGMLILGLLAIAFLLFPLAAFAGCGKPAAAAQAGFIQSKESLFGKSCGGTPLSPAQASLLAASWADPNKAINKNATIGSTPPKTTTTTTTTTSGRLAGLSLLGAIARCTFVTVKSGENVTLQNGDLVLVSLANKDGTDTALLGEIVNNKLVLLSGDGQGNHAVKIANNPNIKLVNGILPGN